MSANIKIGKDTLRGVNAVELENADALGSYVRFSEGGGISNITWHQCPEAPRNFINNVTYDPNDYTTSQIANYAPATAVLSNTKPIGKTVDGVTYYNEVPNTETPFSTANKAGTLKPLDKLRWLNTSTGNVRDLGGWSCDGGTVKYGMLLRGGEPNVSDKSLMVDEIGIKHELQLRGTSEEPQPYSVWGIEFSHTTNYVWLSVAESTKPTWKEIFDCVFNTSNKNIPLYFHCAAGADRTGTVAVMLEALLGMSQSDIDKDYELTCFSTGTGTDTQARRRNEDDYKNYIAAIKEIPLVGDLSDTFRNRAVSFVLSLGYTIDQINTFRKAMINGNPTDITATIPTHTITKTLTNATVDNSATSVVKYQPYVAKLTPSDGYAINNVQVTMGGVNITSQVFKGTKTNLYRGVTKTLEHCTADGKMAVIDGQDFTCKLTASEGYTLDESAGASIVITVGGTQVYPEESPERELTMVIENGKHLSHNVGGTMIPDDMNGYACTTNLIPAKSGKTYTLTCNENPGSNNSISFHFLFGDDSNTITELSQSFTFSDKDVYPKSYSFTPSLSTSTQLRIRGYANLYTMRNILKLTEKTSS